MRGNCRKLLLDLKPRKMQAALIAAIFLMSVLAHAQPSVPAEFDANELVRQMVSKYQNTHSFRETSETVIRVSSNPEIIQDAQLQFKRPNLVMFVTKDPDLGTIKVCCNGQLVTLYSGRQNFYVQVDAPPNLVKMAGTISQASQQLMETPLNQVLSPLSFLAARGIPMEAKTYTYGGRKTIEGHKTVLVKALANPDWVRTIIDFPSGIVFDHRELSLWIEPTTMKLIRSEAYLAWHKGDDPHIAPFSVKFQETHRNQAFNLPMRDEDFKLVLPKGAEEKFSDHR
jgi:outer membrane lipoprotein-sorting protein